MMKLEHRQIYSMVVPICEKCMPKVWERPDGRISHAMGNIISLKVKIRDNWTCQTCKRRSRNAMTVHHIMSSTFYPTIRYDMNNCITLCKNCHRALEVLRFCLRFLDIEQNPITSGEDR